MGCGNCGSGTNGKPGGCKSNGGCSSGGCNRLNVFDWLSTLPLPSGAKPYNIIELSFNKGSRKDFYRINSSVLPAKGEMLALEGVSGFDVGQVSLTGELVKLQLKKNNIKEVDVTKKVLRTATDTDIETRNKNKAKEPDLLTRSRAIARQLNLEMKLCEVEIQADGKKATFFYTADQRVDFRELIKQYASDFRVKVEMKQIGARQESGKVGGIGSCGRELCCSTWLTDFKSVNTAAARYQNLSINQTKLSGQCGRLKCCLNFELDTYMDALKVFPENIEYVETIKGRASLQKRDIFKNLMWFSYSDSNKQYPLSIDRVNEILALNKAGKKADELQPVELEVSSEKFGTKADMGFVNDVGQISLRSLEKGKKKKKKRPGGDKNTRGQGNSNRSSTGNNKQTQGQRSGPRPGTRNNNSKNKSGGEARPSQNRSRTRPKTQERKKDKE